MWAYLTCSAVFLTCFPPDTTEYPKSSHLYTAISRSMKVAFFIAKIKASPRNPRTAHLLASFLSYFTKILVSSAATACKFLYRLTKNPTAQLHHWNCVVKPKIQGGTECTLK